MYLSIDGPDPDNIFSYAETIHFGKIDSWGSLSMGGDFMNIMGKPLGAQNVDDINCKGSMYELSPETGGNTENYHPNSTIAIKVISPSRWQLSATAYISGHSSVDVGQLCFKEDSETEYIPFTTHPQVIKSGESGTYVLYYDLGIKVEFDDRPGSYSWQITYTLSSY